MTIFDDTHAVLARMNQTSWRDVSSFELAPTRQRLKALSGMMPGFADFDVDSCRPVEKAYYFMDRPESNQHAITHLLHMCVDKAHNDATQRRVSCAMFDVRGEPAEPGSDNSHDISRITLLSAEPNEEVIKLLAHTLDELRNDMSKQWIPSIDERGEVGYQCPLEFTGYHPVPRDFHLMQLLKAVAENVQLPDECVSASGPYDGREPHIRLTAAAAVIMLEKQLGITLGITSFRDSDLAGGQRADSRKDDYQPYSPNHSDTARNGGHHKPDWGNYVRDMRVLYQRDPKTGRE